MTRFTMTHNEAANLILSSTKLAKGSEVFVLKMKVMKTIDLAETMIDLFGNGKEFKIIETGIRHGEKMHEELITEEEGASVQYYPLHLMSYFRKNYKNKVHEFPNANSLKDRVLSLPIYPTMTQKQFNLVISCLK